MRFKRLLSGLLAAAVMSGFSAPVSAAKKEEHLCGDFAYIITETDDAAIVRYTGSEASVTIPREVDGRKVVSLGAEKEYYILSYENVIEELFIPEGVTLIGKNIFNSMKALKSVSLPDGITAICDYAFSHSGIESIKIPDTVTSIGKYAFTSCNNLTEITFPDGLKKIATGTLSGCKKLKKVVMPDSVESIFMAFDNCVSLTEVKLSANLTRIGDNSFTDCKSLKNIDIPPSVTYIGENSFSECKELTFHVCPGSCAETFFKERGMNYISDLSAPKPEKPKNVSAVKSAAGKARITWSPVNGADGYAIYSASSKAGTYKKIGIAKAGKTSVTIPKLTSGKTYRFKVRAYKTVDGKRVYGDYSAAVKVKL